ncbi:polyketide synthase [Xenorhabdus bovienii]|uniref:beta-ketoacyl synthase N-terminal-like domain-containing protein n=1 Tax=Xenorhabdus bovienii TaxID=40576 RepID=UPI0023B20A50|nr:polyketide synthase [Xenorhabdus bovienii]MDE9482406.1 polyketide synthase [Xenorhabdus bovienii]MDE9556282.1 polyketide synthase [Xenorhabdus bovienii]
MTEHKLAIVGVACRFPGAQDKESFWRNLQQGHCAIQPLDEEQLRAGGEAPERYSRPGYVTHAALLEDMASFDARFFGFNDREASLMDPQQRQLLEVSYQALEDAGYTQGATQGITGVYACGGGVTTSYLYDNHHYFHYQEDGTASQIHLGNDKDFLATRLAFKLNLTGPALTVQTACSSALAALHQARAALLLGEIDMAVVAAAAIRFPHVRGYHPDDHPILSRDGRCRPFSEEASGTIFGSGVGVVVLKKLNRAQQDLDQIYAVLHASAMNNDGANKVGYSASSVKGQTEAMTQALSAAGITGERLDYIECHATATRLGDPLEIKALSQIITSLPPSHRCLLGSVKSNIGHLEQAAGMASLIKVALMLRYQTIVPTLACDPENEKLKLHQTPFSLARDVQRWPSREDRDARFPHYAGINCLGIGGTNVFAVLSDYRTSQFDDQPSKNAESLLCLSARTPAQLVRYLSAFQHWAEGQSQFDIMQLCRSTNPSRSQHKYRFAAIVTADSLSSILRHAQQTLVENCPAAGFYTRRIYLCQPLAALSEQALSDLISYAHWPVLSAISMRFCILAQRAGAEHELLMVRIRALAFELGLLSQLSAWGIRFDKIVGIGCAGQILLSLFEASEDEWLAHLPTLIACLREVVPADNEEPLPYVTNGEELHNFRKALLVQRGDIFPKSDAIDDSSHLVQLTQGGALTAKNLLEGIGRLYCAGAEINWQQWFVSGTRENISLPVYPFEKKHYWFDR